MAFSLLNGLSALGGSVSQFAGTAALDIQKSQLAQQAQLLADRLATTRETGLQATRLAAQSSENALSRTADKERLDITEGGADRRSAATIAAENARAGALIGSRSSEAAIQRAFEAEQKGLDRDLKAGPFPGDSEGAMANRIMLTLQPALESGTIKDDQRKLYAIAESHYTKLGAPQWVPDPNDPSKQVLASVPGKMPEGFLPSTYRPTSSDSSTKGGSEGGGTGEVTGGSGVVGGSGTSAGGGGRQPEIIPGTSKRIDVSATESKAAGYANRMALAKPIMESLDDTTTYGQKGLEAAGKYLGYNLNSPDYQRLRTAQEAFLSGIIRQESGAAVSENEWKRYAHLYFPMPGEDMKTVEMKRKIRESEMRSMIQEAGPSYKPPKMSETTPGIPPSATNIQAPATGGGWTVKRID